MSRSQLRDESLETTEAHFDSSSEHSYGLVDVTRSNTLRLNQGSSSSNPRTDFTRPVEIYRANSTMMLLSTLDSRGPTEQDRAACVDPGRGNSSTTPTYEAERVNNIKSHITACRHNIVVGKQGIRQHDDRIKGYQQKVDEAKRNETEKAEQLKVLEARRNEMTVHIRDTELAQRKFAGEGQTLSALAQSETDQREALRRSLEDVIDSLSHASNELRVAKQQLQLRKEIPDDMLRSLARELRSIPEVMIHSGQGSSDGLQRGPNEERRKAMLDKWRALNISDATMADLATLRDELDGAGCQTKLESITTTTTIKPNGTRQVESGIQRQQSRKLTLLNANKPTSNNKEMTASTLHAHLEAIKFHSAQVDKYMAALCGDRGRKRANEDNRHHSGYGDDDSDVPLREKLDRSKKQRV